MDMAKKDGDYYLNGRSDMLSFVPESYEKVLEVGCGAGNFSKQLSNDAEKWGIEPVADPDVRSKAEKVFTRFLSGTYGDMQTRLPDNYFDLVVCNDVIEHMPDAPQFFRNVMKKLAPGGRLIGSLPNVRQFRVLTQLAFQGDFRYEKSGILDETHHYFFTKKSLKRFLSEAGFESIELKGITPYDPKNNKNVLTFLFNVFVLLLWMLAGRSTDVVYSQIAFSAIKRNG